MRWHLLRRYSNQRACAWPNVYKVLAGTSGAAMRVIAAARKRAMLARLLLDAWQIVATATHCNIAAEAVSRVGRLLAQGAAVQALQPLQ